ncbi:MAG: VOC family protein [Burkholderiales bacterium]|nr:VOC family protein [Burkholderiales bacterium]
MILGTMFVLAVPNLATSTAFYRDVLGFTIHEVGDPGWRIMERDSCRIMAGECPDALPPAQLGDHSYFAYLVVDDVDNFFAHITSTGTEITKPIASEPWGMREFGLRTVDGHRIMIGQDIGPNTLRG